MACERPMRTSYPFQVVIRRAALRRLYGGAPNNGQTIGRKDRSRGARKEAATLSTSTQKGGRAKQPSSPLLSAIAGAKQESVVASADVGASPSTRTVEPFVVDPLLYPPSAMLSKDPLSLKWTTTPHEVPMLAHNLRKTLFSPGVHPLRNMRNGTFNFDKYLQEIIHPTKIEFRACQAFVPSSLDDDLQALALEKGAKFTGSTSSLTAPMSQVYFAISRLQQLNFSQLSPGFRTMPKSYTRATLKPVTLMLRPKDGGIYSIDSFKAGPPENQILLDLGKSMERMLTMSPKNFNSAMLRTPDGDLSDAARLAGEEPSAYSYLEAGDMLLRAQLDCFDPDLPKGRQVFDIKTRATVAVRLNVSEYDKHLDYKITRMQGVNNSYEREFFDMVRSCFIKYGYQMRIGKMHGAFVAYHNTSEIFGFEYVPLWKVEECIYGSKVFADISFDYVLKMLSNMLNTVVSNHPSGVPLRTTIWFDPKSKDLEVYSEEISDDKGWNEEGIVEANDTDNRVLRHRFKVAPLLNGAEVPLFAPSPIQINPLDDYSVSHYLLKPPEEMSSLSAHYKRFRMQAIF